MRHLTGHHRTDGILGLRGHAPKRRKVVCPTELPRRLLHVLDGEAPPDVPHSIPRETRTFAPIENPVLITFRLGGESRMKILADTFRCPNGNIGWQQTIQHVPPIAMRACGINVKTCHLSHSMHTRIRATCRRHQRIFLKNLLKGALNDTLNGGRVRLYLPAMIPRPIVLHDEPDLALPVIRRQRARIRYIPRFR